MKQLSKLTHLYLIDPYSDYDVDDEYDDDDENTGLVIEGTLEEEMEYKLHEFDIEPSTLWSDPPVDSEIRDQDAECDPRIKYYADRQNEQNIANYQKLLIEQNKASQLQLQAQTTPTSPSALTKSEATVPQTTSANTSVTSEPQLVATTSTGNSSEQAQNGISTKQPQAKNRVADPRLKRNLNNNLSPTGSSSPSQDQLQQQQSDLISIQTRQVAANSLLSYLPDLQFPKETAMSDKSYGAQSVQQQQAEPKGVKLSIEDYKRKLNINKPSTVSSNFNNSITNSTMSILNSLASSTSSAKSQVQASESANSNNSLPSIPSYSVNLQAPQSLHELLRNFQSS